MRKSLSVIGFLLLCSSGLIGQTSTTTIQIVAPASLGTVTPSPVHYVQNVGGPISLSSSTNGFNSTCTATVGTTALPVTFSATTNTLTGTITPAMVSGAVGTNLTITITCTPSPLTLNLPPALPNGKVGVAYSASLPALTGISGGVPPYSWTLTSGSLPPGVTLSSSGVVSGLPSGAGSFNFGFTVKDSTIVATSHSATLTWVASTSSVTGYTVYRGTTAAGPFHRSLRA
jgi:large repetitive protein